MDCRKARLQIPYAVDRSLNDQMLSALMDHLTSCKECSDLFNAHQTIIHDLNDVSHAITHSFSLPKDFSDNVIALVNTEQSRYPSIRYRLCNFIISKYRLVSNNRKAMAFCACALTIFAISLVSSIASKSIYSTPIATARVNSGHLVSFSVKPRPDGSVIAQIKARRYCQVTRSRGEALR